MLSPEIWNFKPPSAQSQVKYTKNEKEINTIIQSQYFNHLVSVTVPNTLNVQHFNSILLDDADYYHISQLKAYQLVDETFINSFVKKGYLTLLSVETKIDQDNCLAITPCGHLLLSLCRKTFQELGLEGKLSNFSTVEFQRYIVDIDLTCSQFIPGKKNYARVAECLNNQTELIFDVILFWEPPEKKICPSSIAAFLSEAGYTVKLCSPKFEQHVVYDVPSPCIEEENGDEEEIIEWLGAINLKCKIGQEPVNHFCNTFSSSSLCKTTTVGQVACLQLRGLFTANRLEEFANTIREYLKKYTTIPWVSLHVQGFEDSITTNGLTEHSFYMSGDYHYTVFFRNRNSSLVHTFVSPSRKARRKSISK